ncbi:MAG: sigma 54-interacting transcriptional regulator [Candidatus Marinimicrobia bacterium]|nr:sigma 54-interacting transcriptional regulator [Candidatus Neomarinimicrobiota bacterium]
MGSNKNKDVQKKTKQTMRNFPLIRITFVAGAGLITAALLIGFVSYQYSYEMMRNNYQQLYLNKAEMIVGSIRAAIPKSDNDILKEIYRLWETGRDRPTDEYICVVDQDSKLLLHSANPETIGNYTGDNQLLCEDESREKNLGELVKSQKNYVGKYINSRGTNQIAAFVPLPEKGWFLGVHRSQKVLEQEIEQGFQPVILGFLLVCGVLMPIALLFLFKTYHTAQKELIKHAQALQESENRYQSLVDSMPQCLYRTDLIGKFIFANRALLETLDLSLNDCLGKSFFDFYPDHLARQNLADDLNVIRTGVTTDVIEERKSSDKEDDTFIETIKSPVFNAKGEIVGVQGISWDITDKKMAEEKLEHTKAHLEALMQSVPSGIIAVDTEGKLTIINQKAEQILGICANSVQGKHITDVIPDSGLTKVLSKNVSEFGKAFHWADKTLMVSRSPIYGENQVIGAVSVFHDQSELESMQKQLGDLQRRNDEFSSLGENSYDGILIIESETVVNVNASYGRITGLAPASLVGKKVSDLDSEKHVCLAVVQELFRHVRRHEKSLTMHRRLNSGNIIFVTASPVLDHFGQVSRVVMNIRDVTELKSLEDQVEGVCRDARTCRSDNLMTLGGVVVAESQAMRNLVDLCERVAQVDSTVLLTGETGVGKDVLSRLIRCFSKRKNKPFVTINCGAIPENLLESELFGYEKGAFSGAVKEGKPGLFEQAEGGIVFLDEVGELPLDLQVKLLKVIQDQRCRRLGSIKPAVKIDVRILAATNRNLKDMVSAGEFREDLFYRLYVVPIDVPPLRRRRDDIMPLALLFLKNYNEKYGFSRTLGGKVLKVLESYDWPGNVRELQNVVERMVVTADREMLEPHHLPESIYKSEESSGTTLSEFDVMDLRQAREILERRLISKALAQSSNTREAAKLLGVAHSTVVRKVQKLGQDSFKDTSGHKH